MGRVGGAREERHGEASVDGLAAASGVLVFPPAVAAMPPRGGPVNIALEFEAKSRFVGTGGGGLSSSFSSSPSSCRLSAALLPLLAETRCCW